MYLKTISEEEYDDYCDMFNKYTRKAITESIQLNKKFKENIFFHVLINFTMNNTRRSKILNYIQKIEQNIDELAFRCIGLMKFCTANFKTCVKKNCFSSEKDQKYFRSVYHDAKQQGCRDKERNVYFNPFRDDYNVEEMYGNV